MAQVMPSTRVTDPPTKDAKPSSLERQDTGRSTKGEGQQASSGGKLTSKLRPPAISTANATATNANDKAMQQNGATAPDDYDDGDEPQSQAAIDPLSQHILQRTNTSHTIQKLRAAQAENNSSHSLTSPNETRPDSKQTPETVRERDALAGSGKSDKKKGVSFLSRFIGGNKRKGTLDGIGEDASEVGETRLEGMDAQLFSHTADNLGYSPKYPQPPNYIKVRAKFKKQKEFDRLFLAQELRAGVDKKAPPTPGANPAPQSGVAAKSNPIWALEFSKDGKYLAAGGQDRIVRVWAVISTNEERRMHEKHESTAPGGATHLSAPVFQQKALREYHGHTGTILDISWSKNNFLLSSSMDKTVRLWHVSRNENLCTFKHADFVPSVQFHPRDDRFFLAGSLDTKLRLWSIPDKSVAYWTQVTDMITSVAFTPDGKTCIAGTLGGLCMFYETEGLKYQTQMHVKSTRGQNAKGSKITGIQAVHWPPGKEGGDVKLLISSNDSRLRLYNFKDKSLEMKFRGHENNSSQIKARVADDTGHIICGSEDRKAYIWATSEAEGEKKNQRPVEMFEAHNSITTCTAMAPLKTRQHLSASEDPIFDLCNPPPVTLVARAESVYSSKAPTEADSAQPTPAHTESNFKRAAESPAYLARSAHPDGNIIVTADYTGAVKVFRQDCAFQKRHRASDNWDTASVFSKKANSMRPSSILSHRTGRSRRDSVSTQPPNDRIMSWRQDISHGSFDSMSTGTPRRSQQRSVSPRKSRISTSSSVPPHTNGSPALGPSSHTNNSTPPNGSSGTPKTSVSMDREKEKPSTTTTQDQHIPKVVLDACASPTTDTAETPTAPGQPTRKPSQFDPIKPVSVHRTETMSNPMSVYNGQSWAFWNNNTWREQLAERGKLAPSDAEGRPELLKRISTVSQLSSEMSGEGEVSEGEGKLGAGGKVDKCGGCGGKEFLLKSVKGGAGLGGKREEVGLFCKGCGGRVVR